MVYIHSVITEKTPTGIYIPEITILSQHVLFKKTVRLSSKPTILISLCTDALYGLLQFSDLKTYTVDIFYIFYSTATIQTNILFIKYAHVGHMQLQNPGQLRYLKQINKKSLQTNPELGCAHEKQTYHIHIQQVQRQL